MYIKTYFELAGKTINCSSCFQVKKNILKQKYLQNQDYQNQTYR